MNISMLQEAVGVTVDGQWGKKSCEAFLRVFSASRVDAIKAAEESAFARRLGVSLRQLRAVARVESAGGGHDRRGRPTMLYERHKFHRHTGGKWSVCSFSNSVAGGYKESSWGKLLGAVGTGEVDAAFMSCSWGKFQVLGEWWDELGYASPYALARSAVDGEAAHFELLCRYLEFNGLTRAMADISADPESCRGFAKGYNGPRYRDHAYHQKLAAAMA
jgi:hypothetical protein